MTGRPSGPPEPGAGDRELVERELRARVSAVLAARRGPGLVATVEGPPGIGKTHLAIGLAVKAAHAGYSVLFDTASNWITRLAGAHQAGHLETELKRIRRYKLIIIDEVGYIPFDHDAANLFFQLIASRYEQGSVMVTSNLPFGRWGETFSDDVVAAAMIDRLVHHAEVIALQGDSYRLKDRDLTRVPTAATDER